MAKQFIKLNASDEHLSIGNLFRIIKEMAKNRTSALQTEIFCVLFNIKNINDTTVNNYCVGARSIGSDYKQIFLYKEKRYQKNKEEFADTIIDIINIMDGTIHVVNSKINFINKSDSAIYLCKKLFNLAKNDRQVTSELIDELSLLIDEDKIYEALIKELLFIVLEKKQPLFETDLKKEVMDNILSDTSISSISLQEYLSLKLREGINYDFSMKKLALSGNAYANYELGCNEYYGYVTGKPRYHKALEYLAVAAGLNHASANYMLGNMYVRGYIGSKNKDELKEGYEYLEKAVSLGNVAAMNLLGNMYRKGIYPLKKDIDKAKELYLKASQSDYAYAYNNLGKLEEDNGNFKEAYNYYLKSANLGESWACNKVGEYYRTGIIEKNLTKAYMFYNRALDVNYNILCYYAYYNLAKYYYLNGVDSIAKDYDKAIEYLTIASEHNILEATIELFYISAFDYKKTRKTFAYDKLLKLKKAIESHYKYNDEIRINIEKTLKDIIKKEINIKVINDLNN